MFLAEHDLDAVPPREVRLFSGGQGTGKTQAVARNLAGLRSGNVLVLIPTIAKAEELKEEIEGHDRRGMRTFVWYSRTQAVPKSLQPEDAQANADAFVNFNRRRSERMCSRSQG